MAGVKSKDLTYLWSDFVARPLDGTQADGRVVALQREGGGKSRLDAKALRTEFCIDWYWVYSRDGMVVFEVYSHTTCGSASCDSARTANAQDACLDDGTGAGGDAVTKITNNVSEPCMYEQVQKFIDLDFKNHITKLINEVFGESQEFNLEFENLNLDDDSDDGITATFFTSTKVTFMITLNDGALASASKEYIMATVFHELLHAYLGYLGYSPTSDSSQHQLMANEYITLMTEALIENFDIPSLDANHLAWGGLHDSDNWTKLSLNQKKVILETNHHDKLGLKGTKCK